jgi:hypothetical protein
MVSSFWISLGSWITGTREVMITSGCAAVLDRGKLVGASDLNPRGLLGDSNQLNHARKDPSGHRFHGVESAILPRQPPG